MPTFVISDQLVIEHGTHGAVSTLTDFSDYYKSLKFNESVGDEEITTFGTVSQKAKILQYLLNEEQFDGEVFWDATYWSTVGQIIRGGDIVSFNIYPAGNSSGNELIQCNVLFTNRTRDLSVSAVDKGTVTIKRTGPPVETTVS